MERGCSLLWKVLVGVLLAGGMALAQVTTGTILGTVSDSTGAVIPGATVAVRNVETGISRTVTTDAAGRYHAPQLGLGGYEVTAESAGFQTTVRSGITLTVGREAVVDFSLQVGAVTERITVTGEAPLVETTSSAVSALVEGTTVREIPLNGRSFDQLVLLQPGVFMARPASAGATNYAAQPAKFSAAGARPNQSITMLDGTNINGLFYVAGSAVGGRNLGIDAIREFRLLTNNYSAEYGRTLGAVVNIVSQSGTNELHGSVFEFLRNSALDAKNFFDRPAPTPIPPFKRNQFGGLLGGPVVRDRTFFFGAYEGLRERLGVTNTFFVPTMQARQGILPDKTVVVDPAVKPYLDLYPVPNGAVLGGGSQLHTEGPTRPTTQDFWQIRMDHQFSPNHSLFGRYTQEEGDVLVPNSLSFGKIVTSGNYYLTFQWTAILSPTVLNSARFGYSRPSHRGVGTVSKTPEIMTFGSAFTTVPGLIRVGGLTDLGRSGAAGDTITIRNSFQYSDDVTVSRGPHTFKFGGIMERFRDYFFYHYQVTWEWNFANLEALLTNSARNFRGALPGASPNAYWRQWLYGFYIQDDWRVHPRLTLNLGLRYEFQSQAVNANKHLGGLFGVVEDSNRGTCCPAVRHPFRTNPTLKNLAPRFGFAWDVFGNGRTAIRGGFGVTYEPMLAHLYTFDVDFPPLVQNVSSFSAKLPNPFVTGLPQNPVFGGDLMADYNTYHAPSAMQLNLNIQEQLPGQMAFQIGYVGALARHQGTARESNYAQTTRFPDGRLGVLPENRGKRRNPNYGNLGLVNFNGNSSYNSLQLSVQKPFRRGFMASANYTWSKSIDEYSSIRPGDAGSSSTISTQNPDCLKCERSISDWDRRQVFNTSVTYELPLGPGRVWGGNVTGLAGKLLGGWEVSGIATANSGLTWMPLLSFDPVANLYTILPPIRPDLKSGKSNNPISGVSAGCAGIPAGQKVGDPARWYDPCAFQLPPPGYFGNLGRNTITQPGLVNFDLSFVKNTRWAERYNLQFRAEFFNIFNHPNFDRPERTLFSSASGTPSPTAGRISSIISDMRQIQFALRLNF